MNLKGFIFGTDGKTYKVEEGLSSEEYQKMWDMLHLEVKPEESKIKGFLILKEDDKE